jgi:hypothetical protein
MSFRAIENNVTIETDYWGTIFPKTWIRECSADTDTEMAILKEAGKREN